jgi:hypothetical protein
LPDAKIRARHHHTLTAQDPLPPDLGDAFFALIK